MSTDQPKIVISGAGLISPLGLTREQTWSAIRAGRCGMGLLTAMEQNLPEGRNGGQCPDLPAEFSPELPREVRYLRRAIGDALIDCGANEQLPYSPDRCGILLGTTLHGMRAAGQFLRTGRYASLSEFLAGSTVASATRDLPFSGLAATTCSACSSSLGSIALAVSLLRAGELDLIVAGGYDTISEYVYGGFNSLRLVAAGPLRPFTRGREGMKLAEGYGIVVLERAIDAAARGRQPLATMLGYGESADAHHLTQPHPQGEGAARAVSAALASAGINSRDIDLIAAHATGTPDNDAGEYAALSRVFGKELCRIPVVAFKSHLGHTLGGAGAVELILSAMCLRDQFVPACANVKEPDLEFSGLRVSATAQSQAIRATLNTSLGFGGANTCMILGPAPDSVEAPVHTSPGTPGEGWGVGEIPTRSAKTPSLTLPRSTGGGKLSEHRGAVSRDVFITGIGVVLPNAIGNDAFIATLGESNERRVTEDTGPIAESQYVHLLNARRVRRMSDYVKLSLAATMLASKDAGITDIPSFSETCSAILGSAHGSTNYSEQYYRQIVDEGFAAANPLLFAEGVPNAAAAHLSLMLSLKGPCQTVIGSRTAGIDSLRLAALRIGQGEWDRAIVGAAEEYSTLVNNAYRQWGLYSGKASAPFRDECGFATGCGAVTLVLESARSIEQRGGKPRGRIVAADGPTPIHRFSLHALCKSIAQLGDVRNVLSSANGTWLDRMELGAVRRRACRISSLAGYFPECFSVTPMAGVAAVLLTRRLPKRLGETPCSPSIRDPQSERGLFTVLASDYTRLISGVTIEVCDSHSRGAQIES